MKTISTKKWGYMVAALAAGVAFCPAQAAHDPHEEASEGIHATFKRLVEKVGETRAVKMVSEWHDRFKEADPKTKAAIKIAAGIGLTALSIGGLVGTHAAVRTVQKKRELDRPLAEWTDTWIQDPYLITEPRPKAGTWSKARRERRGLREDLGAGAEWVGKKADPLLSYPKAFWSGR